MPGIKGTDAMRVFDHLTILALIVLIIWSVANLVATAQAMVSRFQDIGAEFTQTSRKFCIWTGAVTGFYLWTIPDFERRLSRRKLMSLRRCGDQLQGSVRWRSRLEQEQKMRP